MGNILLNPKHELCEKTYLIARKIRETFAHFTHSTILLVLHALKVFPITMNIIKHIFSDRHYVETI